MCIRDSIRTMRQTLNCVDLDAKPLKKCVKMNHSIGLLGVFLTNSGTYEKINSSAGILQPLATVSYTHLDVYKRQAKEARLSDFIRMCW